MEDMLTELNNDMRTLQLHLADFRKLSKWTSEELAYKCDVTKQNISRLEHLDNNINRFQYISLRLLFESIASESEYLEKCLLLLFYNPDIYREKQKEIDGTVSELSYAVYNNMEQSINFLCKNKIEPLLKNGVNEFSSNWFEYILWLDKRIITDWSKVDIGDKLEIVYEKDASYVEEKGNIICEKDVSKNKVVNKSYEIIDGIVVSKLDTSINISDGNALRISEQGIFYEYSRDKKRYLHSVKRVCSCR